MYFSQVPLREIEFQSLKSRSKHHYKHTSLKKFLGKEFIPGTLTSGPPSLVPFPPFSGGIERKAWERG